MLRQNCHAKIHGAMGYFNLFGVSFQSYITIFSERLAAGDKLKIPAVFFLFWVIKVHKRK